MVANTLLSSRVPKLTSVFSKISVIVAVCSLIFAAALTMLSIDAQHKRADAATQQTATELTPMIARQILGALRFDKQEPAADILEAVINDSHGKGIAATIIRGDGSEFTHYSNGGDIAALNELAQSALSQAAPATSADGFSYALPIYVGEGKAPIGAIATEWTPYLAIAEGDSDMMRVLLITACILAVCLAGIGWAIYLAVVRPLNRVNSAMAKIASEDYATEVPYRKRRDEIGAIAKSLEDFRLSLAQSQQTNFKALLRGSALEASSAPLMMTNNSHEILYANPAMTGFFRSHLTELQSLTPSFSLETTIGMRADSLMALSGSAIERFEKLGQNSDRFETRLGASTIVIEIAPILDASGTKVGQVAEWRDITVDQRNATVIGAIDANQLRAEFSSLGILKVANAPLEALLGEPNGSIIGRDLSKALIDENGEARIFEHLQRGDSFAGKLSLLTPNGRRATIDGIFAPIKDAMGTVQRVILLARDITEAEDRETRNRSERAEIEGAQKQVVDALRNALADLSKGNLTVAIDQTFALEYEQLRSDFNSATRSLLCAMQGVHENANAIRSEAHEISSASEDLSRRTEQQAATLEQAAAALNQLTASVQSAAEVAGQANAMVATAKTNAETSGAVVREAVLAMGEIEESSGKISKITSVIDEIAFQTNLLALNAGVEAARAGEAGRGFAVVASEVRALAQRSSDAAREIASLISSSNNQVKRGVGLVDQAGDALRGIEGSVGDIYNFVSEIAVSAREQSSGLAEINTAVNHLDQVTQQNAAMFEETTAASHSLTREAQSLTDTMSQFALGDGKQSVAAFKAALPSATVEPIIEPMPAPAAQTTFKSNRTQPARASIASMPTTSRLSALAMVPTPDEAEWEDF